MPSRLRSRIRGSKALWLLALVLAFSLAARLALISEPCRGPCRTAADHVLIFDEDYYVNAARIMAGIRVPPGMPYAGSPAGDDPNSEHPQLAKVIMAGSIELFGDGPVAWRLGSVLAGTVAILGMFALARAAGAGALSAVGAAALMAADNLLLVAGRIGTLDIYVGAAMVWGVALYLRRRPVLAGMAIGVGACMKLVAPYALLSLAVLEGFRWLQARGKSSGFAVKRSLWRLGRCVAAAAVTFLALLAVLDQVAPPYNPNTGKLVGGGPFGHITRMTSYAAQQRSPRGPTGIASYPWQWLGDYKPILYLNINPARPGDGLYRVHPAAHFLGMISPPILLVGVVALLLALWRVLGRGLSFPKAAAWPSELGIVGLAWVTGTFAPFELASLALSRTSYLYYMVIVMPGLYLLAIELMGAIGRRWLTGFWIATIAVAAVLMYPFTPLP